MGRTFRQPMVRMALWIIGFTVATAGIVQAAPPGVVGDWRNEEGDSVIRVSLTDDGTLVGVGAPGGDEPDRRDTNNPDPQLRGRRLLGAKILWGFRPSNDQRTKWSGGKIYDPANGKTYSCKLELKDGELHIRGYVGLPMFGRTTVWKTFDRDVSPRSGEP